MFAFLEGGSKRIFTVSLTRTDQIGYYMVTCYRLVTNWRTEWMHQLHVLFLVWKHEINLPFLVPSEVHWSNSGHLSRTLPTCRTGLPSTPRLICTQAASYNLAAVTPQEIPSRFMGSFKKSFPSLACALPGRCMLIPLKSRFC